MRPSRARPTRAPHRWQGAAVPLLLALALGLAWWGLRAAPAAWVDAVWAGRLLPAFTALGAPLVAASPRSLSAVTVIVVALATVASLVARRPRPWWAWACVLLVGAGATFELAWGVAYRRTPIETRWNLPVDAPDATALHVAVARVAEVARASAPEPISAGAPGEGASAGARATAPDAVVRLRWPADAWPAAAACVAAADALASARDAPLALAPTVRALPPGMLLRAGFGGFVAPWWREPHVDAGLPAAAALATGLHELTHATGWAREAETDALGTLAGLRCDAREVRFAAAVHALALLRAEARRFGPAVVADVAAQLAELPEAVAAEGAALQAAVAHYARPTWEAAAGRAYDAYLRAQGIPEGRADYGRAAVLLTASLATCGTPDAVPLCPPP